MPGAWALLVVAWAIACVAVALPAAVRLSAGQGNWAGPTSGLRVSDAAPLLRGGERAGLLLRLGGRGAASVTFSVSRRRPERPVRLEVFDGRSLLGGVELSEEPRPLRVTVAPGVAGLDLQLVATSFEPGVPAAYFVHEIRLDRAAGLWSRSVTALPLLAGLGVLWWWPRGPRWLGAAWAAVAAAATTLALVPLWDPAAGWQITPARWLVVGCVLLSVLASLVAVTRSLRADPDTPPTRRVRAHLARQWGTWAAALAALPQLVGYAQHPGSGGPLGWVYAPRVETLLRVSVSAGQGGPLATEPIGGNRYSVAPHVLNDVGFAALVDLWTRLSGERADTATLAGIDLGFLAAACAALILVWPRTWRWALVPVFLGVPLCPPHVRSHDTVAIHGALAALALVAALAASRWRAPWGGAASGALLFVLHAVRSVYLLYAVAPLVAVSAVVATVRRGRLLSALVVPLAVYAALDAPWRWAMAARAADPRVVNGEALRSHNVYQPLISGIGWSENRWRIVPWDVDVAMFIGERLGEDAPEPTLPEGDVKAREVYLSLWSEAPGHLAGLYLRRVPAAFGEHFLWGGFGALLWLLAGGAALVVAWRRRDAAAASVVLACFVLASGFVAQVVLIDPRPLYAYPLRLVCALGLAASAAALADMLRARPSSDV